MRLAACLVLIGGCGPSATQPTEPPPPTMTVQEVDPATTGEPIVQEDTQPEVTPAAESAWDRVAGDLRSPLEQSLHVVRVRVLESGSSQSRTSVYGWMVVEVIEFLEGNQADVRRRYRNRFPVFEITELRNRHAQLPPTPGRMLLQQEVGAELVVFVDLPSRQATAQTDEGAPSPLDQRFGDYDVPVQGFAPAARADEIVAALAALREHRQGVSGRAAGVVQTDRFVGYVRGLDDATSQTAIAQTGRHVARWLVAQLGERLGVTWTLGSPRREGHHATTYLHYPLRSGSRNIGQVHVVIRDADGIVTSFRAASDELLPFMDEHAGQVDRDALLQQVTETLGLSVTGGEVEREVSTPFRGDGAHLLSVEIHAGEERQGSVFSRLRAVHIELTPERRAIYSYSNDAI